MVEFKRGVPLWAVDSGLPVGQVLGSVLGNDRDIRWRGATMCPTTNTSLSFTDGYA